MGKRFRKFKGIFGNVSLKEAKQALPEYVSLKKLNYSIYYINEVIEGYVNDLKSLLSTCYIVMIHGDKKGEESRIIHVNANKGKAMHVTVETRKSLEKQGLKNYVSCTKHKIKGIPE